MHRRGERTMSQRRRVPDSILAFFSCLFVLFVANPLFAAPSFPRGEGLYYNPFKFFAVLVVYLCWVRTCWWVDVDARALKLPRKTWNPLLLGSGLLGLLAVWAIKAFVPAFFFLLLLYLGGVLSYVYVRNEKVDAGEKVLTPRHLRRLAARLFKRRVRDEEGEE